MLRTAGFSLTTARSTSPINGRAGSVLVNDGNVIKANDITMTTINQIVPTYVTFTVPERNLSDIKKYTAMKELQGRSNYPRRRKAPGSRRAYLYR